MAIATVPLRRNRVFLVVWLGQSVSVVGTGLTGFALAVWVYQETGSVTRLSLVLLASQGPGLVAGPFAGALIDRWDRRRAMILSDTGAGIATLVIAALIAFDALAVWHLLVALSFASVFQAFQFPAYSAATTLLVPKSQFSRAAGLVQLSEAAGQVVAPVLAGLLLVTFGLETVIFVDVITFLFAVGTLLVVRVPQPHRSRVADDAAGSLWRETVFGFRYIVQRRGLLALQSFAAFLNLLFGWTGVLIFPLVLSFASAAAAGSMFSLAAIGMVAGSLVMSAWGGPNRRIRGVFAAVMGIGVGLLVAGLRPSLVLVGAGTFAVFAALPVANSSSQALWQAKVEPDVQGRVFAVRRTVAAAMTPIALVTAGPLADRMFTPAVSEGGFLEGTLGALVGVGRGEAAFFIVIGVMTLIATAGAYLYPRLRLLEDEVPDAVPDEPASAPPPASGSEEA